MEKKKNVYVIIGTSVVVIPFIICVVAFLIYNNVHKPQDKLIEYVNLINEKSYDKMYELTDSGTKQKISKDDFIARNKNIYEGMEVSKLKVDIKNVNKNGSLATIEYETSMDTLCGNLEFSNSIVLSRELGQEYKIQWDSKNIFPDLTDYDKIKIKTIKSKRGDILDRNGVQLATDSISSNVGIVPGKLTGDKEKAIKDAAKLLEISPEYINKEISASYVKADMFIPIKLIPYGDSRIPELLKISGIKINDKDSRVYPLGEQAAHLVGYIQTINKDELDKHKDQEYNDSSVIGKAGLEKAFEDTLRGIDGAEIYIQGKDGEKKKSLISKEVKDGTDLKLTIDANLQSLIYNQLGNDKAASVAMNPNTGEVLALVSTPSYNPNDFVLGMSNDKWTNLNNDPNKPLYNRFQAAIVPGSSFKPITAVIGVDTKKIDPNTDKNIKGLSWKKNNSWGNYSVTRVSEYGGASNLLNALVYSDNIYFAQAAIDIGKDVFKDKLNSFGFTDKIPFEYPLYNSQFSSNKEFKSEVQLADSGYGQAEVLVNPVHLGALYTMFENNGDILNPTLIYSGSHDNKVWKSNVVSKDAANLVLQDLIQVVENPAGTGHAAFTSGLTIAGKTGTAELKTSQTDTTGTETGWFVGMTTNKVPNNLLVVMMVEDVKNRGGSHYVVPKAKKVLETVK
ncbi:penicillin-binding protein [Clostridium saccharoperbutylacetonicum]|uniref:Penicillin-binding protein 3 n=2 Tax=Clostridium TaxID=1485 RepID=M1MLF2_9CLOT|nr:penicillin-binding transpeptidase domain-containing protein [Clostridium saccharoperbutylacetonicum]AGF57078.1 penicillin-binding protein 3 [Clostridium saccharoperbutylacetonicum N1-4(HMT)]NRT62163.1 penicillin-binding protein [Clostridium saccharoperbutylacetonicum]NSB25494.1 penicillin-binding protein [Clostridium saccharoperbutylacetonicum]NSB44863.1 penicillin-binding protein [Clostridium saccharoperbutylacetonicum]